MPPPLVAIENLTWAPDEGAPLFEDVDFAVSPGDRLALRGPSGSGKSTLLRCLVALESRRSGTIEWRGDAVEPSAMPRFRRRVHYVHQQPVAVDSTVEENLAFAREMGAERDGTSALTLAEQRDLLERLQLSSRVDGDRAFDALSVGEQQRVALVRSLTLQPAVLLLDEPTAALDRPRAEEVRELVETYVEKASDDRALVWASHDHGLAADIATETVDVGELASGG